MAGLDKSTVKNNYLAPLCYNDILTCPFGIHTSLTAGIPAYRIVYLNSEAKDVNETITDNGTVGYFGTTDAVTTPSAIGVVKFGCEPDTTVTYLPGINKDLNVSVTLLGTMIVEVEPGEVIAVGDFIDSVGDGKAAGTGLGDATTELIAMMPATGVGTADNPEYIVVLVK